MTHVRGYHEYTGGGGCCVYRKNAMSKVCSCWSCAFLAVCSTERMCSRENTFFIPPRNSNF